MGPDHVCLLGKTGNDWRTTKPALMTYSERQRPELSDPIRSRDEPTAAVSA
jgi:hypothetical protein